MERELEEELSAHRAMTEDRLRRDGMSPEQAHAAAARFFGNMTLSLEDSRDAWAIRWMQELLQDLRYALRQMRRNPGFTAVAILTLALGIGANTAIFSVVDATVLRPLPYLNSDLIVFITDNPPRDTIAGRNSFSPLIDEQRRFPEIFSHVASVSPGEVTITGVPQPEPLSPVMVSPDYFSLLGVRPALGRDFLPGEEKPGAPGVVILSDSLWRRDFNADPAIIGRSVVLDNVPHIVIGVMPHNFENPGYSRADLWLPQPLGIDMWIARISDRSSLPAVRNALKAADAALEGHGPKWQLNVTTLRDEFSGDEQDDLAILLACAGFVLLVAFANVANLLLARGAGRRLEITVRSALGASRSRIGRQMLTESVMLGCIGGIAGLAVAYWTLKVFVAAAPVQFEGMDKVQMDFRVLCFVAIISFFTALLFGVFPAMRLTRVDLSGSLKEGYGSGAGAGVRHSRALNALVGSEMALALILMLGASLMVRSFLRLRPDHPGFDPSNKLSVVIRPAQWKYQTPALRMQFLDQLIGRVSTLPNVKGVTSTDFFPFSGTVAFGRVFKNPGAAGVMGNSRSISPNYFQVMDIPILSGRSFTETDNAAAPKVAVISRQMAEQIWPGENVLGKHFTADYKESELEIVGVAGNTRISGMNLRLRNDFYVPMRQSKPLWTTLIISTQSDPLKFVPAVRSAILSIDKDQALASVRTVDEMLSTSVALQRFEALLVGSFAGIALILASVGIYGVISYSVKQRSRELGIRIALGASPGSVMRLALRSTMVPVTIGLALGWAASFGLARFISSVLYGLSPTDAVSNIAAVAILCAVAAAACYIPARHALKIDPAKVLRCE
jgi:putative ABC transport system permease protein